MSSIPDATCEESSKIQIEFSPLVLESAALKLFQDMSKQQISYCIWKSIDRFEEGVRGELDDEVSASASPCSDSATPVHLTPPAPPAGTNLALAPICVPSME